MVVQEWRQNIATKRQISFEMRSKHNKHTQKLGYIFASIGLADCRCKVGKNTNTRYIRNELQI